MSEHVWAGTPASPGIAAGPAWRLDDHSRERTAVADRLPERELEAALTALRSAVRELESLAQRLPAAEAEIVETGALMAEDPVLVEAIERAILTEGLAAGEAILRTTEEHAAAIAALGDETLAARADDVRSLGRRASRLADGDGRSAPPSAGVILITHDLGPGDVAELAPEVAGIVLGGGSATAHAAIVARSLGIPMVAGLKNQGHDLADGTAVVVDGSNGIVVAQPLEERRQDALKQMAARDELARRARALRDKPAVTSDGRRVLVLANVASREELTPALEGGAEGVGLLRTELAFLDSYAWPTEPEHLQALTPIIDGVGGRRAVVRVLDFGADKSPPFLRGTAERGIALLLANPDAFGNQLRALLRLAATHDIRLLLPMVETAAQLAESRALLTKSAAEVGLDRLPPLGSMIETPAAAENATSIAALSDFLSIGTNDLTASTLGADRFSSNSARTHDPRVLRCIAESVAAAHDAGIPIEVCGEAASDPTVLPLLVGLGIDEVSVGAARVGVVREWIRELSGAHAAAVAHAALTMETAEDVEAALDQLRIDHALVR